MKQFDIFQVHRVKTQNEREKKFCKAIELKRYTKRRLIVEPLSNLDNGIQALGAVGKHTEKVRPVQLSMPDISSHLVTKYELEHHLDIFCFNRNGFNYPTMPSKSPCESKSTEKLLKNTLLVFGLTSENSVSVILIRGIESIFLTNYVGNYVVKG